MAENPETWATSANGVADPRDGMTLLEWEAWLKAKARQARQTAKNARSRGNRSSAASAVESAEHFEHVASQLGSAIYYARCTARQEQTNG